MNTLNFASIFLSAVSILLSLFTYKVNAVFYLEKKVVPEVDSLDNIGWVQIKHAEHFLYVCNNERYRHDDGKDHFVIVCAEVQNSMSKSMIYDTVNFYTTFNPLLAPFTILVLGDKYIRKSKEFPAVLRVGFIPATPGKPIDFPLFMPYGEPVGLTAILAQLRPLLKLGVSEDDLVSISIVFNVVTILDFSTTNNWKWQLPRFVEGMRKFMTALESVKINQMENGPLTTESWRIIGKLFLNKMIDPCSVPSAFNAEKADPVEMCKTYCQYLRKSSAFFGVSAGYCNKLSTKKAACKHGVCTCYTYWKASYPVNMVLCNNDIRIKLDKIMPTKVSYKEAMNGPL